MRQIVVLIVPQFLFNKLYSEILRRQRKAGS